MARDIKAVIDRNPAFIQAENGREMTDIIQVWVSNSDSGEYPGVSSAEVDTGGDQLLLEKRIGAGPVLVQINRILWQDEGMMLLECR